MLADFNPVTTLAVSDLQRARDFYGGLLGFPIASENPEGTFYSSGAGSFFVYQSGFAGTNKATAMSIQVPADAFDAEVDALRDKGVSFQTFEAEGMTWDAGVASFGDYRAVWFDDPDGNILNVESVSASD